MPKLMYTEEYIINEVNNDENSEFIEFIKIKGAKSRFKVFCKKHNIEYEIIFENFHKGVRCSKCAEEKRTLKKIKWTKENIINYIKDNSNDKFIRFIEYNGLSSIVELECDKGHIRKQNFRDFKSGKRCYYCYASIPLNINYIREEIEKVGFKLLSNEYKNNKTLLTVMCDKGHVYTTNWCNFKNGKRCPKCYEETNASKGVREIEEYLIDNNIEYIREYTFNDCKSKNVLRFDFYLPQYNCCIEFDGQQHFIMVDYFGGFDGFVSTVIRDTIKNIYCKDNNINLIRIPYNKLENIKNILNKKLK